MYSAEIINSVIIIAVMLTLSAFFSGMEIEIHPCLTFHLTLQNVCQQCRDIYGLSKRAIQCFAAAF